MKFLKFTDYAAFAEAFQPFMSTDNQGDPVIPSYIGASAVDVVGVIYKPTGEFTTSEDGTRFPVMAPLDGWHVNLSDDCPVELEPFLIDVAAPVRVFA